MKIDKIETKRGKTTVFCGEKAYPFVPEILQKYGLKEGETDPKDFFGALNESEKLLCKRALYAMIDRAEKCKNRYKEDLLDKGYSFKVVTETVDEAEKRGLIDDRRYAECYIHLHEKSKGWYRIRAELMAKGVAEEVIEDFKEDFGDRTSECKKLAEKLSKGLEMTFENRQKLYAKLMRKGYTRDEIERSISPSYEEEEPFFIPDDN